MEITIPLKAKYRVPGKLEFRQNIDPPYGTGTYLSGRGGAYRARTGNSSGGQKVRLIQGIGIRRRAYNTHKTR